MGTQRVADLEMRRELGLAGVELWLGHLEAGVATGGLFPDFGIGAIRGAQRHRHRGHTEELDGEYVLFSNAYEHNPVQILRTMDTAIVFVSAETLRRELDERGSPRAPAFRRYASEDRQLSAAIYRFAGAVRGGSSRLECQELFSDVLDRVLAQHLEVEVRPRDAVTHRAVRRMRDVIRERYAEDLTLDELAAHAGLNRFYALRLFRHVMGAPPHTFQLHWRVAKAMELLRRGRSATETAHALGFFDQSHLTRTFGRLVHWTPSAYQRVDDARWHARIRAQRRPPEARRQRFRLG
jgi:AraC-like DNA-binding protein